MLKSTRGCCWHPWAVRGGGGSSGRRVHGSRGVELRSTLPAVSSRGNAVIKVLPMAGSQSGFKLKHTVLLTPAPRDMRSIQRNAVRLSRHLLPPALFQTASLHVPLMPPLPPKPSSPKGKETKHQQNKKGSIWVLLAPAVNPPACPKAGRSREGPLRPPALALLRAGGTRAASSSVPSVLSHRVRPRDPGVAQLGGTSPPTRPPKLSSNVTCLTLGADLREERFFCKKRGEKVAFLQPEGCMGDQRAVNQPHFEAANSAVSVNTYAENKTAGIPAFPL